MPRFSSHIQWIILHTLQDANTPNWRLPSYTLVSSIHCLGEQTGRVELSKSRTAANFLCFPSLSSVCQKPKPFPYPITPSNSTYSKHAEHWTGPVVAGTHIRPQPSMGLNCKNSIDGIGHKQGTKEGNSKEWQREERTVFRKGQMTTGQSEEYMGDGKKPSWAERRDGRRAEQ